MCLLLQEGLLDNHFDLNHLGDSTTKEIYKSMTETLPLPNICVEYPDRDWTEVWERLNSGVLRPLTRDFLFFIVHDRVFTRERGYRIQHHQIEDPYCLYCSDNSTIDTVLHKYCECSRVVEPWNKLRDLLEDLDFSLIQESDHSLLNLYYKQPLHSNSVLWLIGEYLTFIDNEQLYPNKSVSVNALQNHLRIRWLMCSKLAIPMLDFIPGLFPTGVG